MKKKLWKQWRFWLEVGLGLLVAVLLFYSIGSYGIITGMNSSLEANGYTYDSQNNTILSGDRTMEEVRESAEIADRMYAYYYRFSDANLSDRALDFGLSASDTFVFGLPVSYQSGDLTINYAKVDTSGLMSTYGDFAGVVIVGISFNNTSSDIATIDTKEYFPILEDGSFPFYDSVVLNDENAYLLGSEVSVRPGSKVDFAVIYGTNKQLVEQKVVVRQGQYIWE